MAQRVSFKTARGKKVSFMKNTGRRGPSAAQKAQRRRIAAAGRACAGKGKPGTAKNAACLRDKLRA